MAQLLPRLHNAYDRSINLVLAFPEYAFIRLRLLLLSLFDLQDHNQRKEEKIQAMLCRALISDRPACIPSPERSAARVFTRQRNTVAVIDGMYRPQQPLPG